jgi:spore cortex formation protein SpoVR/YcgB (stage V sporulation)
LQWLQNPSEINVDIQKIVRCEARRYFRNKNKTKVMNELATNSNNKKIGDLYKGIN